MRKCLINSWLLIGCIIGAIAQVRPLGQWLIHPSFESIQHVSGDSDLFFAASENGLFSVRNGQINPMSKSDGLSDQGVGALDYIPQLNALLLGYRSGLIDLVYPDRVIQERAIYRLDSRLPKQIYDLTVIESFVYFGSDLGVIQYDLNRGRARDIYQNIGLGATKVTCFQIASNADSLYAFTDQGLLVGNIQNNLLDFGQWQLRNDIPYSPSNKVEMIGDTLFISQDDLLVKTYLGYPIDTFSVTSKINALTSSDGSLWIGTDSQLISYREGKIIFLEETEKPISALAAQQGSLIVGTVGNGVYHFGSDGYFLPDGPLSDKSQVSFIGDTAYLSNSNSQIVSLTADKWSSKSLPQNLQIIKVLDINGIQWLLDQQNGLYNPNSGQFLSRPINDGLFTDAIFVNDVLWMSMESSETPLAFSEDFVTWTTVDQSLIGSGSVYDLTTSTGGLVFMKNQNGTIIAYDPQLNQATRLTDFQVNDFVIDYLDELYVATNDGLYSYQNASSINEQSEAFEVFISSGELLQEDFFTSITVDAGNRKWLATNEGLWLYDDSFDVQISHYSSENSELPSNDIQNLDFQLENGLLWISTANGLTTLQTDAKAGNLAHQKVEVFPNPIQLSEGHNTIGIRGLAIGVTVKITSISGQYINEVSSNGGMASWGLNDAYGNQVGPGIYLLFSADPAGIETYVGKFLVEP